MKSVSERELIEALLKEIHRNICPHEETYRGGVIWEICHACGVKWADDEGGKPAQVYPQCVVDAENYLSGLSCNGNCDNATMDERLDNLESQIDMVRRHLVI